MKKKQAEPTELEKLEAQLEQVNAQLPDVEPSSTHWDGLLSRKRQIRIKMMIARNRLSTAEKPRIAEYGAQLINPERYGR